MQPKKASAEHHSEDEAAVHDAAPAFLYPQALPPALDIDAPTETRMVRGRYVVAAMPAGSRRRASGTINR